MIVQNRLCDSSDKTMWCFGTDCAMVQARLRDGSDKTVWWFRSDCVIVQTV